MPDRLTEVVALTVAQFMDNAYERVQHERLSLKLGFGEAWVRDVLALRPEKLSGAESLVQRLALAMTERKGQDAGPALEAVTVAIGCQQAVAVLLLVGRYVMHALIVNTLNLAPPVPSPLTGK